MHITDALKLLATKHLDDIKNSRYTRGANNVVVQLLHKWFAYSGSPNEGTNAAVRNIVQREIKTIDEWYKIESNINTIIHHSNENPATESIVRTTYRKWIRRKFGADEYNSLKSRGSFAMTRTRKLKRAKAYGDAVEAKLQQPITIPKHLVCRFGKNLLANALDIDCKLEDMVIFVIAATGSRLVEVLKLSDYKADGNNMIQTHLGKERLQEYRQAAQERVVKRVRREYQDGLCSIDDVEQEEFELNQGSCTSYKSRTYPTLWATPTDVCGIIQRIRSLVNIMDLDMTQLSDRVVITKAYITVINKKLLKLGHIYLDRGDVTTRFLRRLYASYSYSLFADKHNIERLGWFKSVLGHDSSATSRLYLGIVIKEPDVPLHILLEREVAQLRYKLFNDKETRIQVLERKVRRMRNNKDKNNTCNMCDQCQKKK